MSELNEDCERCGHPWNPHVLVATLYSPQHGGLIFCDQPGCMCQTTWSVDGHEGPYIPPPEEVEDLRLLAQSPDVDDADDDADWDGQGLDIDHG